MEKDQADAQPTRQARSQDKSRNTKAPEVERVGVVINLEQMEQLKLNSFSLPNG